MIRRSPSQLRGNFTILANATLSDARLSWEARGLLSFLLSKPDHWVINVKHLINESPSAGRDKIYSMLKELEDSGYLTQERKRDNQGHWGETERVVHELPTVSTVSGFAVSGSAVSGKSGDIVSTEVKKVLNKERTEFNSSSAPELDPPSSSLAPAATPPSEVETLPVAYQRSEFREDAERLCHLLHEAITANGIRAKSVTTKNWYIPMELIMRIDGYPPDEVERVLLWSQRDPFWHENILSPKKFREKFETLRARSNADGVRNAPRGFTGVREFLEEIG